MFTKKLLLSMVATSFVLTGCGGGGGSGDDYNTESKDSLANGTRYYYIQYSTSKITDRLRASYIEVQNKQFKDSKSNKALGYYLLTENKLYTPKDIAQNTIDLDGLTHWTFNTIGAVKSDWRFEKVNLSGKNMFDTVFPAYRQLGFDSENAYAYARIFLNSYGSERFPNGSSCYRLISQKDQVDSFNFDVNTDNEIKQSFEDFDDENLMYVDQLNQQKNGLNYRYASGIWQSIPWSTVYDLDFGINPKDGTAVEFQNRLYVAEFNPNFERTLQQEAKVLNQLLTTLTDKQQKRNTQLRIAEINTGCYIYNETAAKSLVSLRGLNWDR
ncbi:hypothetical protein HX005_16630 [Acinetobacter sp. R933-2]|uniref:hypothetical protein n=1 Tax=Acinetobacter sp. R933-2 TaxID=2746728 RepID=UPI0025758109|nr:hypothetical protein [Acinetobacter sp. R933-2]MDM1249002.1 hypothetical protein [Acinetobacter sp. R933-2]